MVSTKLAKSNIEGYPLEELVVGDLVEFSSGAFFSAATDRYSSHGVIISVRHQPKAIPDSVLRNAYTVHWSDGRETTEWRCYLKKLS